MIHQYNLLETIAEEPIIATAHYASDLESKQLFGNPKIKVFGGFEPFENFISIYFTSTLHKSNTTFVLSTETRLFVKMPHGFKLQEHLTNPDSTDLFVRMFLTTQDEHNSEIKKKYDKTIFNNFKLNFESPAYYNNLVITSLLKMMN